MSNSLSKVIINFNLFRKNLKDDFSDFIKLTQTKVYLSILVFFNLFAWLFAHLLKVNVDSELIFLHYNILFGRDLIGAATSIYFWPLLGLGLALVNIMISIAIFRKYKLLTNILLIVAILNNIFLILAIHSIYLVNFVNINI